MRRKNVPDNTQKNILTRSRRRCCLCLWLGGIDEVQKGQIAHIDHNNQNATEDNLVFLCFEHHDEYDSETSTAKGLTEKEVKHWRDELYKEMEYRFRTLRRPELRLVLNNIRQSITHRGNYSAHFELHNDGDAPAKNSVVSVQLPEYIIAQSVGSGWLVEKNRDFFEPGGRVGMFQLFGDDYVILPGHSLDFTGLNIPVTHYPTGTKIDFNCQLDAEGMEPIYTQVSGEIS